MKKLLFALVCVLFTITASAESWTKTFVVTKGSESAVGLSTGDTVIIKEENYTRLGGGIYYIEHIKDYPTAILSERVYGGGNVSMNGGGALYDYYGNTIKVSKNGQKNPDWMRIGGAELREKR